MAFAAAQCGADVMIASRKYESCVETAKEIALDALRVHGGYGNYTEYDVERYYRDAPLMIVGEGTNEIQRNVIVSQLISRGGLNADSKRAR